MDRSPPRLAPLDAYVLLYRAARLVAVVLVAALLARWLLVGLVPVASEHMAPALLCGDRVLVLKAMRLPLAGGLLAPRRGSVVLLHPPAAPRSRACLRVAALGGDSIMITGGTFVNLAAEAGPRYAASPEDSLLPADYSSRDFLSPLRLPRRGETIVPDSLAQRDFIFAASLYAQEHPRRAVRVRPLLLVDGIPSNEYFVGNFLLYKGAFGSIPDSLNFDWFFWDRLRENLRYTLENRKVVMRFSLLDGEETVDRFRLRRQCAFLLADNWSGGLDSRYFGPVSLARVEGGVVAVLWSLDRGGAGTPSPRWERMFMRVRRA